MKGVVVKREVPILIDKGPPSEKLPGNPVEGTGAGSSKLRHL